MKTYGFVCTLSPKILLVLTPKLHWKSIAPISRRGLKIKNIDQNKTLTSDLHMRNRRYFYAHKLFCLYTHKLQIASSLVLLLVKPKYDDEANSVKRYLTVRTVIYYDLGSNRCGCNKYQGKGQFTLTYKFSVVFFEP